jgi:uncharacterized membrane protein
MHARLALTTAIFLSGHDPTVFAFHYAHEFYSDDDRDRTLTSRATCLTTPTSSTSFVIGTPAGSDVSIASRRIRHPPPHGICRRLQRVRWH